jgi:hypothetical protein
MQDDVQFGHGLSAAIVSLMLEVSRSRTDISHKTIEKLHKHHITCAVYH